MKTNSNLEATCLVICLVLDFFYEYCGKGKYAANTDKLDKAKILLCSRGLPGDLLVLTHFHTIPNYSYP